MSLLESASQPVESARPPGSLDDRYLRSDGTIYLTGIQALVRMLLERARHDRGRGLEPAAYVTGYEGSPLAGYDLELARRRALLEPYGIRHQPALNEELAATAVAGTQLAGQVAQLRVTGVTGVWYGKAPGLDRATDALRHAGMVGTDPHGGAVALVGDDPAAKSSTLPGSSEHALADLMFPTFAPADPAEILEFGRHAVELSRASGFWTAIKIGSSVADSGSTALLRPSWTPPDLTGLPEELRPHVYGHRPRARLLGAELAGLERSLHAVRMPIALEYLRRSGLNRVVGSGPARIGIMAAGKTYLDVRQALTSLGLDEAARARWGIRLFRVGVVFPLEPEAVTGFAAGLDEIVVVEDKRAFLEDQLKSLLYGRPGAPAVVGKRSREGTPLFAPTGELDPDSVALGLARHLSRLDIPSVRSWSERTAPTRRALPLTAVTPATPAATSLPARTPYFCSGCPHNSSTKVPEGTLVGAGIGCHTMVVFMPESQVGTVTGVAQMGGEGGHWIGMAPFVTERHLVQNLGDGTFAHSGSLAVRAAVAAGVDVTFKLLRNSAVAMTGGQHAVGELPLDRLVRLLQAEGVARVVVTTDQPARARRLVGNAAQVRPRGDLLDVQRELAAVPGVTVLVHEQECAAEKRRKRKRGTAVVPARRAFINERVCEGCGDCGVKSNCLSVHPVDTEFGRKTRIDQSSCNVDLSCLAGDCPSFLTVTPGREKTTRGRRGPAAGPAAAPASSAEPANVELPEPVWVFDPDGFTMRITGVGGTGVVTVAQILATAAAAEGRQVRALDQTGLAQKGGAVVSDLKLSAGPRARAARLADGECDLYLGCDALVATDDTNLRVMDAARSVAVVSTAEVPTGPMVVNPGIAFPAPGRLVAAIDRAARRSFFLDAAAASVAGFGDEQYANLIMVGAAYQAGALPIAASAVEAAIELNGTAVEANRSAFRRGRQLFRQATELSEAPAHRPGETRAEAGAGAEPPADGNQHADLDDLVGLRAAELAAYQDEGYARTYRDVVQNMREKEAQLGDSATLSLAVARYLYKLMAYKDEYEVARLSLDPQLEEEIRTQFGAGAGYAYRLHPPVLRALGMPDKITLGRWARPGFRALAGMRRLRGTHFDPFGRTEVRRTERALVEEYRAVVDELVAGLTPGNHDLAARIAELPDLIRGYEEVKLRNVATYRDQLNTLLTDFRRPAPHEAVPLQR